MTPEFLPGEFHGQRSLVGYSLWDRKKLNTTERLTHINTHTHTPFLSTFSSTAMSPVFIYIFSAPALESAISPRSPNFFSLGNGT